MKEKVRLFQKMMFHYCIPLLCGMRCARNDTEEEMARKTRPQALRSRKQVDSNSD